ncbi:MAG: hypothetical protein K0B37_12855 [Bacteroidales bacterium]|nr:hypothetical protein [Bacteroidales bacterium]
MKTIVLIIALVLSFIQNTFAQKPVTPLPPNSIYEELLGSGFILSFNYQRHFFLQADRHLSVRAGIGPGFNKEDAFLPIGVTYNIGSLKHFFETGLGYTHRPDPDEQRWVNVKLGYKYQHHYSGFLFKAQLTPMFFVNDFDDRKWPVWPWGGIALGWSF